MNKDNFEIALRDQLKSAESAVPADAWAAIQSGLKGGAGVSAPQTGSGFSMGFGLVAGATLLVSLATYSEVRNSEMENDIQEHSIVLHETNSHSAKEANVNNTIKLSEAVKNTEVNSPQLAVDVNAKPTADIVIVQKSVSSTVVNEVPTRNDDATEIEAIAPISDDEAVAIESDSEVGTVPAELANPKANRAHDTASTDEAQSDTQADEVEAVNAIIGASEIIGYTPMTVKFDNLGAGVNYEWDFGKYGVRYEKSPEMVFDEPGTYNVYLTVSNDNGDIITDVIQVKVAEGSHVFSPNAITPNGDGINDSFKVDAYLIESFLMIITNTEGEIVFQTRNLNEGWQFDQSVHDLNGTKYYVTYKAIGKDGKVHAKERVPLAILLQ